MNIIFKSGYLAQDMTLESIYQSIPRKIGLIGTDSRVFKIAWEIISDLLIGRDFMACGSYQISSEFL